MTRSSIKKAKSELDGLYGALRGAVKILGTMPDKNANPPRQVQMALKDDLNTPLAIKRLQEIASDLNIANKMHRTPQQLRVMNQLVAGGALLGIVQQDPEAWFQGKYERQATGGIKLGGSATVEFIPAAPSEDWIESQIEARDKARLAKNFAEADRIRDDLKARGVILEDGTQETTWKRSS